MARPRQFKGKRSARIEAGPQFLRNLFQSDIRAGWSTWLPRALLIIAVTLWIYWPALGGAFVWDDGWYLVTNPLMHGWIGLWKFWFQPGSWVEYYPVQETVQWVQWQLWGEVTLGYHLTNVALHVVSAFLVWRLLAKFGLRLAWLGGLLFAVHPVQVESVAWISELKNTLSLPFFLLAMGRWIDYDRDGKPSDYRWALGLFLIGMLCKITLAPFPVIISLVLGITTILVGNLYEKQGHALPDIIPLGSLFSRVAGSGLIAAVYFSRCFLPVDYLLTYPKWQVDASTMTGYVSWLFFIGIGCWAWVKRATWGRHVLLGLGFYFLTLAPFLGFNPVSYMSFTWVMDHFLYLPLVGLIGLVIAGLEDFETRFPTDRPYATGIFAIAIALMSIESHAFANLFVNEETLWTYILQRNPNVWLAHHDLGCDLMDKGRYAEAIPHLQEVAWLKPGFDVAYYNLGIALEKTGQTAEAEAQYRRALALNPENVKAYLNLGELMGKSGNLGEAEKDLRKAYEIAPEDASASIDLGGFLLWTKRDEEAIHLYREALATNPDLALLHYNLGRALSQARSFPEAIEQFRAAVRLAPGMAQAHENLGVALAQSGALAEGIREFEAAIRINPGYSSARMNLALALAHTGRVQEAAEQLREVLSADPGDAQARSWLMKLQAASPGGPGKP